MSSRWTRRGLVRSAAMLGAGLALPAHAATVDEMLAQAERRTPGPGTPTRLFGKRMYFTSWRHVLPGGLAWRPAAVGVGIETIGSESLFLSEMPHGIRLFAEPAQRAGQVLKPESPAEAFGVTFNTVAAMPGGFFAWGNGEGPKAKIAHTFTSTDGRSWQRIGPADGGYVAPKGSFAPGSCGQIFYAPEANDGYPFKEVYDAPIDPAIAQRWLSQQPDRVDLHAFRQDLNEVHAIVGNRSKDGIKWERLPEPLSIEHSDTQIVGNWDPVSRRFVLYTRVWDTPLAASSTADDQKATWTQAGRRAIGRTESASFEHFPLSTPIMTPGPDFAPSQEFYFTTRTCMPGAPDERVMFPGIYDIGLDQVSLRMASSTNDLSWNFLPGEPVLRPGPQGSWDGGTIAAHPNLLELPDGSFALPYTGYLYPHKYPRDDWRFGAGLALWPEGKLSGIAADGKGSFAVVPFLLPGRRILANATVAPGGFIRIEVGHPSGKAILKQETCVPITGSGPRRKVAWAAGEEIPLDPGTPVMLQIFMRQAKLYDLTFV